MIQSMTGYGAAVKSSANYRVTVELKSLNSKYLELIIKLPKVYVKFENKIRSELSRKLGRGKIVVLLNVEVLTAEKRPLRINKALVKGYLNELNELADYLELNQTLNLEFLLGLPDVIPAELEQEDEEEWALVKEAMSEAISKLIESRREEGNALDRDLSNRVLAIQKELELIKGMAPQRLEHIRNRIEQSLKDIRNKVKDLDKNRFEQELIFYLGKARY